MIDKLLAFVLNLKLKIKLFLFPIIAIAFFSIFMAISYMGLKAQKGAISDIYDNRFSLYQGVSTMVNDTLDVYANTYKSLAHQWVPFEIFTTSRRMPCLVCGEECEGHGKEGMRPIHSIQ